MKRRCIIIVIAQVLLLYCVSGQGSAAAQSGMNCANLPRLTAQAIGRRAYAEVVTLSRRELTYCREGMSREDLVSALSALALGLSFSGEHAEAVRVAEECLRIKPKSIECAYRKGDALRDMALTEAATETFRAAIQQPAITDFDVEYRELARRALDQIGSPPASGWEVFPIVRPEAPTAGTTKEGPRSESHQPTQSRDGGGSVEGFIAAIQAGNEEVVRAFLRNGMSANTRAPFGMPALYLAQTTNHAPVVRLLIEHGANLNEKFGPSQRTALHDAALFGRLECMNALLTAGADVNALNKFGRTPLNLATNAPLPLHPPANVSAVTALLRQFGGK